MVKRLLAFLRCFANGFATGFLHPVDTLRSLFTRKSMWDGLDYGKPATVEDELARLNNER